MTANLTELTGTTAVLESDQEDFGILINPDALFSLITSLSKAVDAPDIANVVVQHCEGALGAQAAIFATLSKDSQSFKVLSSIGYSADEVSRWKPFKVDASLPMAECARQEETLLYNTNADYVRSFPNLVETRKRVGLEAHLAVPILLKDKAIGAIDIGYKTKRNFTETDRALMKIFGEMCAQALEKAHLYESERQAREVAEHAIEARLQSESALERVQQRYHSLFDASRDPVAIALDGIHAYVNQAYAHLYGYASPADLLGKPILDLTAPSDRETMQRRMSSRIAGSEEPTTYVLRSIRTSGEEFDAEIRATVFHEAGRVYTLGIVRDITAEHRAQQQLTESERKFRTLFEQNAFGTVHTSIDRKWLTVNQKMCDIFGYTREELMNLKIEQLIHPADLEMTHVEAAGLRLPDAGDVHLTVRGVRKDGTVIWVKAHVSPLRAADGSLDGFITTTEDVSDQRNDAIEREQLTKELASAYERERRIAESLQRSLLLMPTDQELEGIEVRPVYWAAFEEAAVGGDFYDALRLGGDEVALVVGDISGKGLAAAARTAEVKFTLRAFLREDSSPASALTRLNRILVESRRLSRANRAGEFFVCLCVCVVNTTTGQCKVSIAGIEPAMVFRPQPKGLANWDTPGVENSGLPLGALDNSVYQDSELYLGTHDVLLMTTDGLTDAHPDTESGEFFGSDELVHIARRVEQGTSLERLGQGLLSAARAFAGGRLKDDTCMIIARLKPSSAKA